MDNIKENKWKLPRYYYIAIIYLSIPFIIGCFVQKFSSILFINNYDNIFFLLDASIEDKLSLLFTIIIKNFMVLFFLYTGCVTKGTTTKGLYIINGFILGLYSGLLFDKAYSIMLMLPHGIIEILVYVSAAEIGFANVKNMYYKKYINKIVWQFSFLIIGAFIEVFITPYIAVLFIT